jgi:hypothetical protein
LWLTSHSSNVKLLASRAFAAQPLRDRDDPEMTDLFVDLDLSPVVDRSASREQFAAAQSIASWYLRALPDAEVRELARSIADASFSSCRATLAELIGRLTGKTAPASRKRIKKHKS